jgi:hypothetical protein
MGNRIYGKNMTVDGENSVERFTIDWLEGIPPWIASNTSGGVSRGRGNRDWMGSYILLGHTPTRFPNDSFTFKAWPENVGSVAVSGTARATKLTIDWDIENGDYIRSQIDFKANGALSKSQAVGSDDSSTPGHLSSKGMYVKVNDATQNQIGRMHLELDSETNMIATVDSTSNGETVRTQGDINGRGWWRINSQDPADWPELASPGIVDWYVTATTYWRVKWMRITGIREFGVDRRANRQKRPVGAVVYVEFAANNGTTAGEIINPALATKWS